jgi:hypothetical protein
MRPPVTRQLETVMVARWLMEHRCPTYGIHESAAQGGSIDALEYLPHRGIMFTARILRDMLQIAGACNKLAAAKWLRAQGAEWPDVLSWQQRWSEPALAWSGDTLAWARAEGCTSPTQDSWR